MTIAEMRAALGLADDVSDAAVIQAYAVYLAGDPEPEEPLTLDEVKADLRIDGNAHDSVLPRLIRAAREWVEKETGQALTLRTVEQVFDGFGPFLELSAWPVQSVVSVTYVDALGVEQTLTEGGYLAMLGRRPARLVPGLGNCWPAVARHAASVRATVVTGYYDAAQVPDLLKQAMAVMIRGMFDSPLDLSAAQQAARAYCRRFRLYRC